MQLRGLEITVIIVALTLGVMIPPDTLSGDPGRLLITFLGLFSASVLPTISLMLGSMTASGRSVKFIDELKLELTAATDALFLIFGLVIISVGALISLSIPTPSIIMKLNPSLVYNILQRAGQCLVVVASFIILYRAGQIPAIIRRALDIRYKIASDDARKTTLENIPDKNTIKDAFPTHPDFGKSISMSDRTIKD